MITQRLVNVRFAPKSGHSSVQVGCPLSAISGHHGESVTRSRVRELDPKLSNMSDRHVCKHDADQIEQDAESLRD